MYTKLNKINVFDKYLFEFMTPNLYNVVVSVCIVLTNPMIRFSIRSGVND